MFVNKFPVAGSRIPLFLALVALFATLAGAAQARAAAGPSRIVFVAGKAHRCHEGACHNLDLVRSVSPHGGRGRVLSEIREVAETASADDGTVAVLSRNHAGGGANGGSFVQIYLVRPNGKRTAVFRHRLQRFNATGLGISGNGRLLALSGGYAREYGPSKIWLVRADGSGLRQLTDGPAVDETPALSPDGKRVVFSRTAHDGTPSGRKPELYVAPTAGGEAVRLTENTVEDVNPVWSPDGRRIAFGAVTAGELGSVQTIAADGSDQRRVTSTGEEYPDPDYSPSGRSLVFVGQSGSHPYENALFTVRASGAARHLVSRHFEDPGLPQWTLAR